MGMCTSYPLMYSDNNVLTTKNKVDHIGHVNDKNDLQDMVDSRKSPSLSTKLKNVIHNEFDKFNTENTRLSLEIQRLIYENKELKKHNEALRRSFDKITQEYAMILMGSQSSENAVYKSKLYKSSYDKQHSKESRILMNSLLDPVCVTTSSEKN